MAKESDSGRIFIVTQMLSTRKTVISTKFLSKMLLKYLLASSSEDRFVCAEQNKITLTRDFKPGFEKAYADSLCKVFHLDTSMKNIWRAHIEMLCFRCDVYAKTIILENWNVPDEDN